MPFSTSSRPKRLRTLWSCSVDTTPPYLTSPAVSPRMKYLPPTR
jgi:hypothetical protein